VKSEKPPIAPLDYCIQYYTNTNDLQFKISRIRVHEVLPNILQMIPVAQMSLPCAENLNPNLPWTLAGSPEGKNKNA